MVRLITCKYLQEPKNSTFGSEGGMWVVKSQEDDEDAGMGLGAHAVWIQRPSLCFPPMAPPTAILNELLHPGMSRQRGTLRSTLRNSSLPCRVYNLKRLEMSPGDLYLEEVKIERLLGKAKVIFINGLNAASGLTNMQRTVTRVLPLNRKAPW